MTFKATCTVSSTDKITAYAATSESDDGRPLFSVVVQSTWGNKQEKGSVVLERIDAIRLRDELNKFLGVEPKSYSTGLCEDEGCPHRGKPHVCISSKKPEVCGPCGGWGVIAGEPGDPTTPCEHCTK